MYKMFCCIVVVVYLITFSKAQNLTAVNLKIENTVENEDTQLNVTWDHPPSLNATDYSSTQYQICYKDGQKQVRNNLTVFTVFGANSILLTELSGNTIYWMDLFTIYNGSMYGPVKGQQQTKRVGIANAAVAGIAIGVTVAIIVLIAICTQWHFKANYNSKKV